MGGENVPRLRLIAGRYFWRPTPAVKAMGFQNTALGADKHKAQELAARLNAAVERSLKKEPSAPVPGTVPAVIRDYLETPEFGALSPATRKGYKQTLARIEEAFPDQRAADVTRMDLRKIARALADRPRLAKEYVKLWSIILGHAREMGLRDDNPALGMRVKGRAARQALWTPAQVEAFCAAARLEGRPSIALAVRLAYETTQRLTDILALTWTAIEGDLVRVRQSKTGQLVAVPISSTLQAELAAAPRVGVVVVISEKTGRPYKVFNFDKLFADIRETAKLPKGLWFRDLRRTGLTEAGRGGASVTELQALGGHKTLQQLGAYVVPDDSAARSAARKRNQVAKDGE